MRGFEGASSSPLGGGMSATTRSNTSSMLMPFLAEIRGASRRGCR